MIKLNNMLAIVIVCLMAIMVIYGVIDVLRQTKDK